MEHQETNIQSLTWDPQLLTGDDLIDSQHQRLFQVANLLFACPSSSDIDTAVMDLYKYTREHFRDEEALMAKIGYSGYEHHIQLHENLIEMLNSIVQSHKSNVARLKRELKKFMLKWVTLHIKVDDFAIVNLKMNSNVAED